MGRNKTWSKCWKIKKGGNETNNELKTKKKKKIF